ncbi:hydroxysteroid 11-beta-dehydrogenase 1-like protein isoform X4 [Diceros bicornis minor]|uniref:hydroxysteroid 11-beta-dehydrogenase 1-like protein isoform X4 n=1 Tax=Diceros bicornis minor TaxID=77932 RepID=UPI0026EAF05F|nr:hydroxysteroid 11-beta-dehydrogenase 1-like protein isoform X4 [Diceros bicornis minor]
MTTSTQPPGGPCAADWSQRRRRRGAGLPLRTPGLPPRAHCPHRGPPAEGPAFSALSPPSARDPALPSVTPPQSSGPAPRPGSAPRLQAPPPPLSGLGSSSVGDSQSPPAGELPELRAADFAGAAQPDRQQGLPGGGVLAARPRAHVLLQPLFGRQVRAGRLLRLPAAGAGRAGRERGHHHVRPGPPGPRRGRGGSQGRHEGQGGPGAQGGPGGDPRRRHARLGRLLPLAFPPALPAPGVAAAPQGLVHPPGAQRHRRPRCCLSSWGLPLHPPGERPSIHPARRSRHLREGGHGPRQSSRQRRKTERNFQRLETVTTLGV